VFNTRTNRLECRYCRIALKPFGGRLTPRFPHVPEMWLCVQCGFSIDMQEGINEALIIKGALRRRYEHSRQVLAAEYRVSQTLDASAYAEGLVRQKMLELIFVLLADKPAGRY
jgi:hypothetical protein